MSQPRALRFNPLDTEESGGPWLSIGKTLAALIGVALIVALLMGAYERLDKPLGEIVVRGPLGERQQAEIATRLQPFWGSGILSVDLDGMRQSLAGVDWIRGVGVRRIWPDQLTITVTPRAAIARWGSEQLLADDGRVFDPPVVVSNAQRLAHERLVRLSGPNARAREVLDYYLAISGVASTMGLQVARLELDQHGAWSLTLTEGTQVMLGDEEVIERARRALGLYHFRLRSEGRPVARLDARYGSGVAVRYEDVSDDVPTSSARPAPEGSATPCCEQTPVNGLGLLAKGGL